MKDILIYKDFIGSVHYCSEDEIFYGKIEGINDLVSFEGASVKELKHAFEYMVNEHIKDCKNKGITLEKSFKGSFNVRISSDLHKKATQKASIEGITLNQLVKKAIQREVELEK